MVGTLKTVLVDDETLARKVLREMLAPLADIEIVAECANGFEAVKAVSEHKPDLLLLDIQMPKLDGFEVLELLAGVAPAPAVVFVTAHDQHAIRAFEVAAVDYLLKPYSPERLQAAVQRAVARRNTSAAAASTAVAQAAQLTAAAQLSAAAHPGPAQRIVVRDGTKVTVIPTHKLEYAQAQDDYVALVTEGKSHLKQQTIASLEAQLDAGEFVRIHRSFIARLDQIARVEASGADGHMVVLHCGARLPVSRAGLARLKAVLH